jgi:uncharacterized protein YcbX
MSIEQLFKIFDPRITEDLERLSKFKNAEPRDAQRIVGPTLKSMAIAAELEARALTDWLATQGPADITRESIHSFLRSLMEAPADVVAVVREKQEQLNKEIAAQPVTADTEELSLPIAERSLAALQARIEKLGWLMTAASRKEKIALEDEMDKRDAAIEGVPWEPRFRLTAAGRAAATLSPARSGY